MRKALDKIHPTVLIIYFIFVFIFSVMLLHPIAVLISAAASAILVLSVGGRSAFIKTVKIAFPIMLFCIIFTPFFIHKGMTIILYFPWGSPLTKESIIYGFFTGISVFSVILWSYSFAVLMTTDKLTFIFGKISPSISLVLCVAIRQVPDFVEKFKEVFAFQELNNKNGGGRFGVVKRLINTTSIMMTWALDNGAETAQSMKSRGHGKGKRTSFYRYEFHKRDFIFLALLIPAVFSIVILNMSKIFKWNYFYNSGLKLNLPIIMSFLVLFIFYIEPVLLKAGER